MSPSEMDDKHLVNCIRVIERRFIGPVHHCPIYTDMVNEAFERKINLPLPSGLVKIIPRKRSDGASAKVIESIVNMQLDSLEFIKPMEKVRKGARAIKQVKVAKIKVLDIRARRIILED